MSLTFSSFFENIDRLYRRHNIPNDLDILHLRLRTTGITETVLDADGHSYHLFDVGGARLERKKWVHTFENVRCILFVASLSGYDQCLTEDKDGVSTARPW